MKNSTELKELAWDRLWTGRWFGRLLGGSILLGFCGYAVQTLISQSLASMNVPDWLTYSTAFARNLMDQVTPVPIVTRDYATLATSSSALVLFFSWLMSAIAAFGNAVIVVRCLKNDGDRWIAAAFGGFRDPFGMLWLMVRYVLIMFGWSLLAVVFFPLGLPLLVIAFYRYRFLWLVKADHPDWSAGACLRTCRTMMKGCKMRSFRLDCAYWWPITVVLILSAACVVSLGLAMAGVATLLTGFACGLLTFATCVASLVVGLYLKVGQGFLYRDVAP